MKEKLDVEYFLGIDGGGTKTDFALADINGNIIARKILQGCNPNDVGFKETFRVLNEGIFATCENISFDKISVFAGLAGCSSAENLPRISKFLDGFGFCRFDNHNDAQNAVAAGLHNSDGVSVILGTGCIAYAKQGRKLYRIGGYGYLFGDVGSGFAIGRDTILVSLQHEDGMGEKTVLTQMVKEKCKGQTVLSKIDLFYEKGKREITQYAPIAFDAYELGDDVAKRIVMNNIGEVAKMIQTSADKISPDNIRVSLMGGLTARADIIIPLLEDFLKNDKYKYDITVCDDPPVIGALYLAGMKGI